MPSPGPRTYPGPSTRKTRSTSSCSSSARSNNCRSVVVVVVVEVDLEVDVQVEAIVVVVVVVVVRTLPRIIALVNTPLFPSQAKSNRTRPLLAHVRSLPRTRVLGRCLECELSALVLVRSPRKNTRAPARPIRIMVIMVRLAHARVCTHSESYLHYADSLARPGQVGSWSNLRMLLLALVLVPQRLLGLVCVLEFVHTDDRTCNAMSNATPYRTRVAVLDWPGQPGPTLPGPCDLP